MLDDRCGRPTKTPAFVPNPIRADPLQRRGPYFSKQQLNVVCSMAREDIKYEMYPNSRDRGPFSE